MRECVIFSKFEDIPKHDYQEREIVFYYIPAMKGFQIKCLGENFYFIKYKQYCNNIIITLSPKIGNLLEMTVIFIEDCDF